MAIKPGDLQQRGQEQWVPPFQAEEPTTKPQEIPVDLPNDPNQALHKLAEAEKGKRIRAEGGAPPEQPYSLEDFAKGNMPVQEISVGPFAEELYSDISKMQLGVTETGPEFRDKNGREIKFNEARKMFLDELSQIQGDPQRIKEIQQEYRQLFGNIDADFKQVLKLAKAEGPDTIDKGTKVVQFAAKAGASVLLLVATGASPQMMVLSGGLLGFNLLQQLNSLKGDPGYNEHVKSVKEALEKQRSLIQAKLDTIKQEATNSDQQMQAYENGLAALSQIQYQIRQL